MSTSGIISAETEPIIEEGVSNGSAEAPIDLIQECLAEVRRTFEMGVHSYQTTSCPTLFARHRKDPNGGKDILDQEDLQVELGKLETHLRSRSERYQQVIHGLITGNRTLLAAGERLEDL
jgi:hypothetical protein